VAGVEPVQGPNIGEPIGVQIDDRGAWTAPRRCWKSAAHRFLVAQVQVSCLQEILISLFYFGVVSCCMCSAQQQWLIARPLVAARQQKQFMA
jgi:hypothetical protein